MIILTGVSGGIGNRILGHLLKIDYVMGIYNSSLPKGPSDERLSFHSLDLEKPDQIKSFVKKAGGNMSKVTVVHFAVLNIDGLAANYELSDWDRVMRVNLKGNLTLTQALLPRMIQERWGRIIHISSVVGTQGRPGTIAYSTSKAALIGMSRVLAKEYARFNITSNVLVLGNFEAGLINTLEENLKQKSLNEIPSKAFGKVSNIANAIEFLIKSEFVNGSVITIDGGM